MPDQSEIQEVNQIIARARIAQNEYETEYVATHLLIFT